MAYLVASDADPLTSFRHHSAVSPLYVTELETAQPGWIDRQLAVASNFVDTRLRKRCPVPFAAPPDAVKRWVSAIVTVRVMVRVGVHPDDEQFRLFKEEYDTALTELREAADGHAGLFELPTLDGTDSAAAIKGKPRYSVDASPFAALSRDARAGREQDVDCG